MHASGTRGAFPLCSPEAAIDFYQVSNAACVEATTSECCCEREHSMATTEVDELVKQLTTGFDTLQDEYQQLFAQHQALGRKLATAREQVSNGHVCSL